jgi:hypothetical protein
LLVGLFDQGWAIKFRGDTGRHFEADSGLLDQPLGERGDDPARPARARASGVKLTNCASSAP